MASSTTTNDEAKKRCQDAGRAPAGRSHRNVAATIMRDRRRARHRREQRTAKRCQRTGGASPATASSWPRTNCSSSSTATSPSMSTFSPYVASYQRSASGSDRPALSSRTSAAHRRAGTRHRNRCRAGRPPPRRRPERTTDDGAAARARRESARSVTSTISADGGLRTRRSPPDDGPGSECLHAAATAVAVHGCAGERTGPGLRTAIVLRVVSTLFIVHLLSEQRAIPTMDALTRSAVTPVRKLERLARSAALFDQPCQLVDRHRPSEFMSQA